MPSFKVTLLNPTMVRGPRRQRFRQPLLPDASPGFLFPFVTYGKKRRQDEAWRLGPAADGTKDGRFTPRNDPSVTHGFLFFSLLIQSPNFADLSSKEKKSPSIPLGSPSVKTPQVPRWAEYLALGQFNSLSSDHTFFFLHILLFLFFIKIKKSFACLLPVTPLRCWEVQLAGLHSVASLHNTLRHHLSLWHHQGLFLVDFRPLQSPRKHYITFYVTLLDFISHPK